MNDDLEFKRQWQKKGPGLPKAPASFSAGVWAHTRRASWGLPRVALGSAFAMLLVGLGFWLGQRGSQSEVRFRLNAPRASQVSLSGSFNDWQPQAMHREGDAWVLDMKLKPGSHRYVFVLNGKRSLPDPEGGDAILGSDGEAQSVLVLPKTQAL